MMNRCKTAGIWLIISAGSTSALLAQTPPVDSILWFDVRDNTSGGQQTILGGRGAKSPWINGDGDINLPFVAPINNGGPGAGQVLRLSPTTFNNMQSNDAYASAATAWPNYDGDGLLSTGTLFLYWTVNSNNDANPGVNDVITSLGIDILRTPLQAGTTRNDVASLSFQIFNSDVAGVPSGVPWNNKNDGAATGTGWTGAKAVRIPVTSGPNGPIFEPSLGLTVSATPYRVGQLRVTAGQRNCTIVSFPNTHAKKSSYALNMRVNNLLITRAFQSGGDNPHAEKIAFGYTDAGAPDLANGSGIVQNATTTIPDAIIQIRIKGDSNGDGYVTGADISGFLNAMTASINGLLTVEQAYLFDFTNDRAVNGTDIAGMNSALALSQFCP